MVCRSCRKKNAIFSFYLCAVLACKRPTASLALFMCKPPAFSSSIDLAEKNEAVTEKCKVLTRNLWFYQPESFN